MTVPTIADYLKYANLQMAAESFLVDVDANGNATVKDDISTALTGRPQKGSESHGTTLSLWNATGRKKKKAESPAC